MQGVFIGFNRPKTKKAIKEGLAADPHRVRLEATSMFGNEYDGPVDEAPAGTYPIVGPDPYRARNFYGSIVVKAGGVVTVK